jgi:NADPH:quinone reductase-like Zn-dependent oxidoreductase
MALQVATCLKAASITTICSTHNVDFCKAHRATHVVDYTAQKPPSTLDSSSAAEPWLVDQLRPFGPFDVIMDCVTSDDPRDQQMDYLQLIQGPYPPSNGATDLTLIKSNSYAYWRLSGYTSQWISAGLEPIFGSWIWPNPSDRLYWFRMDHTNTEQLRQLAAWARAGLLRPHVGKVYTFTAPQVQEAWDAIVSRRVQGKVVVSVWSPPGEEKED